MSTISTQELAKELKKINPRWNDSKTVWVALFYNGDCSQGMIGCLYGKRFANKVTKDR